MCVCVHVCVCVHSTAWRAQTKPWLLFTAFFTAEAMRTGMEIAASTAFTMPMLGVRPPSDSAAQSSTRSAPAKHTAAGKMQPKQQEVQGEIRRQTDRRRQPDVHRQMHKHTHTHAHAHAHEPPCWAAFAEATESTQTSRASGRAALGCLQNT